MTRRAPCRPLALALLAVLVVLSVSAPSQAACVARPGHAVGNLIVRCSDGLCSDGFLVRIVSTISVATECGMAFYVIEDLETPSATFSQVAEAMGISMATGVHEIALRACGQGTEGESATVLLDDIGLEFCPHISGASLVSRTGDTAAFERVRARLSFDASSSPLAARLAFLRYGAGGLLIELAVVFLAIAVPFALFIHAAKRRRQWARALVFSLPIQATALGFVGWRMSSDYPGLDFGIDETLSRIDLVCIVLLLIAFAIQATIAIARFRRADAG